MLPNARFRLVVLMCLVSVLQARWHPYAFVNVGNVRKTFGVQSTGARAGCCALASSWRAACARKFSTRLQLRAQTSQDTGAGTKSASFGARVSEAETASEVLDAVQYLAVPSELARSSEKGQRKAFRNACGALAKLSSLLIGSGMACAREDIVRDERGLFARLCSASASASRWDATVSDELVVEEVDARAALAALKALAMLVPLREDAQSSAAQIAAILAPFVSAWPPHIISSAHWAATRLQLDLSTPKLRPFVEAYSGISLPFSVSHGICSNVPVARSEQGEEDGTPITLEDLRREIPFAREQIVTRQGVKVEERRETCWMAEPGVGGLAYSGKIMTPVPFSRNVERLRDHLFETTNMRYDCCLINLYPDGDCACKWHSDPDHGTKWSLEECVVSFGEVSHSHARARARAHSHTHTHSCSKTLSFTLTSFPKTQTPTPDPNPQTAQFQILRVRLNPTGPNA